MSWRKNTGVVSENSLSGRRYEWTIDNFFSLPQTTDARILSPEFKFQNQMCILGLWPCTKDDKEDEEWIGVYFWISTKTFTNRDVHVKIGIQCEDGTEYTSCSVVSRNDDPNVLTYEQSKLLRRKEFIDEITKIAPSGSGRITIFCEIRRSQEQVKRLRKSLDILAA